MKKRKMQKAQEEYERDHCSSAGAEPGEPGEIISQEGESSRLGRSARESISSQGISAPEPQNPLSARSCLDTDTPGLLQRVVLS